MGLNLKYYEGQTPIDEEEKTGLLIPYIGTHAELDEHEQLNNENALQWILTKNYSVDTILSEKFICRVHYKMFDSVWSWAGQFRTTNKNLGCDKWNIASELKYLLDDAKYWYEHKIYSAEEFAIRFKHRPVSIHCFSNGNGRHSRLMADIIIEKIFKQTAFSWGIHNSNPAIDVRKMYLHALKKADLSDYSFLIKFARS